MAAHAPWAGASCLLRPHSPPLPAAGGAGAGARALLAGLEGCEGREPRRGCSHWPWGCHRHPLHHRTPPKWLLRLALACE